MLKIYGRVVYWFVGAAVVVTLLYSLWSSNDIYDISDKIGDRISDYADAVTSAGDSYERESATFVTLARNSDLGDLLQPIRAVEDRFNHKYHYDWVFLNDEEFTDEFKSTVTSLISGTAKFGVIGHEHWSVPEWVDDEKFKEGVEFLEANQVIYAGNIPYRHMCRFESGFFFLHPLMMPYRYYWRVEPETNLYCDIDYDVFKFMRENKKKYGWTLSITEFRLTVRTLWNATLDFISQNPQFLAPNRLESFLTNGHDQVEGAPNQAAREGDVRDKNKGMPFDGYNLCHFWSNFEVADMEFWRGEAYQAYFKHLDQAGGFFYERWGDAPVHSIAAALLLDRDELHFFEDIGYHHPPFTHCPSVEYQTKHKLRCSCLPSWSFDDHQSSCLIDYRKAFERHN